MLITTLCGLALSQTAWVGPSTSPIVNKIEKLIYTSCLNFAVGSISFNYAGSSGTFKSKDVFGYYVFSDNPDFSPRFRVTLNGDTNNIGSTNTSYTIAPFADQIPGNTKHSYFIQFLEQKNTQMFSRPSLNALRISVTKGIMFLDFSDGPASGESPGGGAG